MVGLFALAAVSIGQCPAARLVTEEELMPNYTLYRLDGAERITNTHKFSAASLIEAFAVARDLGLSGMCELWVGEQFVARWDPSAPALDPELS